MTRNIIILKGITYFFLGLMLYMHVCSAWCALSPGFCNKNHSGCPKTACPDEKKSTGNDGTCQDFHFSFFKAAGQFSSENNVQVAKLLPVVEEISFPFFLFNGADESGVVSIYNGFHPPPLNTDLRILIRSFQI